MLFRSDRKSTRLNSSHLVISYAVFCLKKKKSSSSPRAHSRALAEPSRNVIDSARTLTRVSKFLTSPAIPRQGTVVFFFFFNDTATTEIYTLSLHDALPI